MNMELNSSPLELLKEIKDSRPDANALSFQLKAAPGSKSETLTYAELLDNVHRMSNFFRGLGIGEKDVIAVLMPNSTETVISLMAGMSAGIAFPINPLLGTEHIAALVKQTKAKVLVTLKAFPKTDLAQKARAVCEEVSDIKALVEIDLLKHLSFPTNMIVPLIRPKAEFSKPMPHLKIYDFEAEKARQNGDKLDFDEGKEDRICAFFHTGGTTGTPKIAQHSRAAILYNGWLGRTLLLKPDDIILCPLPMFHVFAAYAVWFSCLAAGAHMILPTPAGYRGEGVFDQFWKLIEKWRATFLVTVPTAAAALMQRPVNADVSSLKYALCGSAALPVETFKNFQQATGVDILEGYGMTEATCLVSINPVDGEKKIGSVGKPFPHTDIKILHCDANGQVTRECESDEVGEICIANPGVMVGRTYTESGKNKNLYAYDSHLRSGDLGRIDKDGYLWITGRVKDLIIRGGHNIDPAIIEEALAAHPAVSFVGAIGQPDIESGEIPCAYIELNEGAQASSEELGEFAGQNIGERAAVPRYIEIVPELPKTAVGKVFKPDLRRMAIRRVYGAVLEESGLGVQVSDIIEDKKRGLVVKLAKADQSVSDGKVNEILGGFVTPWEWQ